MGLPQQKGFQPAYNELEAIVTRLKITLDAYKNRFESNNSNIQGYIDCWIECCVAKDKIIELSSIPGFDNYVSHQHSPPIDGTTLIVEALQHLTNIIDACYAMIPRDDQDYLLINKMVGVGVVTVRTTDGLDAERNAVVQALANTLVWANE